MPDQKDNIIKAPNIELSNIPLSQDNTNNNQNEILLRTLSDYLTFEVSTTIPYIDAEDANYYSIFYVPNVKCFLIEARERHTTAASSATLDIEKLPSGTAQGSGSSMLASTFNLSAGANNIQLIDATTVFAGIQLNPGDAMALKPSGTLTNLRGVSVTVLLGMNMSNIPQGQSVTAVLSGL